MAGAARVMLEVAAEAIKVELDDEAVDVVLIHMQALMGQQAMQVIIDTGLGHLFICKDVLHTIGTLGQWPVLQPWWKGRPLGIGGGTLNVVASTVLQLRIGGAQVLVQFAVVQGLIPTLISNNALQRLGGLSLDYEE